MWLARALVWALYESFFMEPAKCTPDYLHLSIILFKLTVLINTSLSITLEATITALELLL